MISTSHANGITQSVRENSSTMQEWLEKTDLPRLSVDISTIEKERKIIDKYKRHNNLPLYSTTDFLLKWTKAIESQVNF